MCIFLAERDLADDAVKMTKHFLSKGYTAEQAGLKVVWENPEIAGICWAMPNMTILQANVAAALNKRSLSTNDYHHQADAAGAKLC